MDTYALEQLDHLSVERSENVMRLTFAPMAETAWFCPGLVVEKRDEQVHVTVVRCRLNKSCDVTHPIDPTVLPPWTVSIGSSADDVYLKDKAGLHLIGPD